MEKVTALIKNIDEFLKTAKTSDDLRKLLKDFPEREALVKAIDNQEAVIAKLLRNQKQRFIKGLKNASSNTVGNPVARAVTELFLSEILDNDNFDTEMRDASVKFLSSTVPELADSIMQLIDKDIAFDQLSQRNLTWIEEWGDELGKLMKTSTHDKVTKVLYDGLAEGKSIQDMELQLAELPDFDRTRARRTAITEVLTASSVAQDEAYLQSPAVTGKTWLHSGPRGINPRDAHVALNGTTIDVNEKFNVNGHDASYPRDTNLPASERVNCHCTMSPSVDESILGLSKEEKERLRRETTRGL